jgi:putative glycosyltransferase (TIGR04372 family)
VLTTHGHLDEAMRVLETVVAKHPLNFLAQSNLGIVLFQAERVAEANHALETAHRINPQHAGVLGNMGIIRERLGDSEAAAECYRQSVKCDPGFALGHASLGRLAAGCGDELAALDHFERALRSTPTLRWLRYELAVLYLKQGKRDALGRLIGELDAAGNLETEKLPDTVSDAFVAITSLLMAKPDLAVPDRERLCSDLMPLAGRLKTLNDPAKLTLLEQMITLNPANLNVYLQLGIAHHHDGQYAPAAKVWLEGLRKRDELAGTAGLLDYPHRVLDGTWTLAVGHLQLFDPYLKSVQLGLRPARTLWLLQTDQHPVPNGSYLDYWRPFIRTMEVTGDGSNLLPTAKAVGLEPSILPLVTDHFFADRIPGVHELWHMEFAASVQRRWEQERRPPLLQLTAGDREFGAATLNKMGVPADAWYVCVHVRESGFWGQWDRYHASIRNADIDTYRVAMEEIVSRGGWVIRMGDDSMRPIAPMRQVVDYAHSEFKSERMDVFLCATARLFVGVNSGPSLLPPTFGGRCLLTNFVPLSVPFPYGADRMLPKRYRSRIDGHLLDLDEMFTTGAAHFYSESHLPDWLEVVDNSAEEIAEGVMEMLDGPDDRLPAEEVQEFDALRRRYDAIVLGHGGFTGTPVGGRYLRRYAGLLGSARTIVHESPWPVVSPHPVIQQQCGSSAP